jgi:hAT family C-terminal dimerisation region
VAVEEDEGWQAELWWYLKDMPDDVTAETNIITWWQVCQFNSIHSISYLRSCIMQNNHRLYLTLGCMALNILPIPVSSVLCEHLFSTAKEIADDCRVHLGPKKFEELQVMKFAWHNNIPDLAIWKLEF